ncbi:MAG: TonB-dependent receptor [Elusimicrobiota bacterium]
MKKMGVLLIGVLLFNLVQICLAEEEIVPTYKLGEIVVTATKSEELIREVPVTAVVITGEEIEKSQAKFMNDVLEKIPGISLSGSDASGRGPVVTLRGVYHYNSSYVLVLVDGMPINSPDTGKPYVDAIPLSNIERIEVIKGGNSAVWGSYAMGGVINIITKEGKKTSAQTTISLSEWNTKNLDFSGQAALSKDVYLNITANSKMSDGWRALSNYDLQTFGGSLTKDNKNLSLKTSLSFGYYEEDTKYPGYLTEKQWEDGDLTSGDTTYFCASGRQESNYIKLIFKKELPFNLSGRLNLNYFSKGYTFYYRSSGGSADINDVNVFTGSLQLSGEMTENKFTVGLDIDEGKVDSRNYAADAEEEEIDKDILKRHNDTDIHKFAIYVQDMWKIFDWLNLNIGVRYDKLKHDITDRIKDKKYNPEVDAISPNLGLLFKVASKLSLFGSISRAFRLPIESQFCKNPDLGPEKGVNCEIGTKFFTEKLSNELSVYQMNVTDKITYEEVSPNKWEYRNVGEVKHQGIELTSNLDITNEFFVSLSGDINQTEILKEPKYPERVGKNIYQVPLWKTSLGLGYAGDTGFGVRADFNKIGEWYMDYENEEKYPGYFRTDLKFSWDKDNVSYYLTVDNIFDEKYCRQAYISGTSKQYYPATPRTFSAGVKVKF